MRMHLLPFVLVACGACLSVVAQFPAPGERQDVVAQIDFASLHEQANTALENLRQSRESRMAVANAATF
jgi:hypothetical protein